MAETKPGLKGKILILGLGNIIVSDDGVGIYVGRQVKDLLADPSVDFIEAALAGLQLLDYICGYEHLVIIDAIQTEGGMPGSLYYLTEESLRSTVRLASIHDVNLATALELGRQMGMSVPEMLDIYAIEAADLKTFSESCTPKVAEAIPALAEQIAADIREKRVSSSVTSSPGVQPPHNEPRTRHQYVPARIRLRF